MKKRVLALVLAVCMVFSPCLTATAGKLDDLNSNPDLKSDITIYADMLVKKSTDTAYKTDAEVLIPMSAGRATADFKGVVDMSAVREQFTAYMAAARDLVAGDVALLEALDSTPVEGEFEIEIRYPDNLDFDFDVTTSEMIGFSDNAKNAFVDTGRGIEHSSRIINITVEVKDGITAKVLEDNLDTYLGDFEFVMEDITAVAAGTYTISAAISGYTVIGTSLKTINYNAVQDPSGVNPAEASISATFKAYVSQSPGFIVTPGDSEEVKTVTIVFDDIGNVDTIPSMTVKQGDIVKLDDVKVPEKEGYSFGGFYNDPNFTSEISGDFKALEDKVVYVKFVRTEAPDMFESDSHILYLEGFPDGEIKAEENITREQMAMILYRLIKAEAKTEFASSENDYTDVKSDRWSNEAISVATKAGLMKGYPDGTFGPARAMTRAEFVTVVSRIIGEGKIGVVKFNDIAGHWAEKEIKNVVSAYLITGYGDGTFRPEGLITRAEAATIINRLLVRYPDNNYTDGANNWPDLEGTEWYFDQMIEATYPHNYTRGEDGFSEKWIVE